MGDLREILKEIVVLLYKIKADEISHSEVDSETHNLLERISNL